MDRGALIPGDDLVHGLRTPGNAYLLANPIDDLSYGQGRRRSVGLCQLRREDRACAENETTTSNVAHRDCSLPDAKE